MVTMPPKRIEIAPAGFVPDILHLSLHDHERLLVVEKDPGVEELLAQAQHLVGGRAGVGLRLVVEGWKFGCFHKSFWSADRHG